MSHTSPATFLVWSILSVLLGTFLIFHLWSFDRFKCLRWNNGPYSGAFKRIMTYSYIISIPLIMTYSVGICVIKYRQGFVSLPEVGIVAKPYWYWPESEQRAIFPFYLLFSIAWSLEMVSHLEELCFWLFLVNSGSGQQNWFNSLYFKTWIIGSCVAVTYMPLVTIFTRDNLLTCEAYTFLAGSLGSLSLTLWFTPILWTFPSFLRNLRKETVDMNTIVRLTKFHEMNTIRVFFRFLFVLPLLALGIDGVRPHQHINESMFWTDILASVAGFGCTISSGITLVIFFPRSIESEIAAKDASRDRKYGTNTFQQTQSRMLGGTNLGIQTVQSQTPSYSGHHTLNHKASTLTEGEYKHVNLTRGNTRTKTWVSSKWDEETSAGVSPTSVVTIGQPLEIWEEEEMSSGTLTGHPVPRLTVGPSTSTKHSVPLRPNRRSGDGDVELGGVGPLTAGNLATHNQRTSKINQHIHNFTSPIDLAYATSPQNRFTFGPRS